MGINTAFLMSTLAVLCKTSTTNPAPQYYPLPYPGQQPQNRHPEPTYSGSQPWPHSQQNNYSHPNNPTYLDPVSSSAADNILKNEIPRQVYGVPPPPASAYPQIYKLDNLVIIANPAQAQPQPCTPQRLSPPDFPNPNGGTDGISNRFGDEPSKCTWAIVACCSPGSNDVRYNCFELLGCSGFFFDNSPCEPNTVMAAANAALEYYRSANNATNSATNNNRI